MKNHKEQDVDAKLSWYIVSALLIVLYITAGMVIIFSSLLDDEFSKSGRYVLGIAFILFAVYRCYSVWSYRRRMNRR